MCEWAFFVPETHLSPNEYVLIMHRAEPIRVLNWICMHWIWICKTWDFLRVKMLWPRPTLDRAKKTLVYLSLAFVLAFWNINLWESDYAMLIPTLKMSLMSFPPPTPQPRSSSSALLKIWRKMWRWQISEPDVRQYPGYQRIFLASAATKTGYSALKVSGTQGTVRQKRNKNSHCTCDFRVRWIAISLL